MRAARREEDWTMALTSLPLSLPSRSSPPFHLIDVSQLQLHGNFWARGDTFSGE